MIYDKDTNTSWSVYRDRDGGLVAERLEDGLIERPTGYFEAGRLCLAFNYPDEVPQTVYRALLRLLSM